eukprot:123733_1
MQDENLSNLNRESTHSNLIANGNKYLSTRRSTARVDYMSNGYDPHNQSYINNSRNIIDNTMDINRNNKTMYRNRKAMNRNRNNNTTHRDININNNTMDRDRINNTMYMRHNHRQTIDTYTNIDNEIHSNKYDQYNDVNHKAIRNHQNINAYQFVTDHNTSNNMNSTPQYNQYNQTNTNENITGRVNVYNNRNINPDHDQTFNFNNLMNELAQFLQWKKQSHCEQQYTKQYDINNNKTYRNRNKNAMDRDINVNNNTM